MTTITAKVADLNKELDAIYNNCYSAEGGKLCAKIRKQAAKMEVGFETVVQVQLLKKIKFGAIRMQNRMWYPVVNGEVHPYSHTFSTGAMADCQHIAGQMGIVVKA